MSPVPMLLDPRRSLGARVAWGACAPLSLAWGTHATLDDGLSASRLLAGLVVIGVASAVAGALASASVRRLANRLRDRGADDLSPVPIGRGDAAEVAAVAAAVDRLLAAQCEQVAHHRRLIAEAAHQLRTPLAALRARLQAAEPGRLDAQVPELLRTVDRATHVANEFLARAKIDQRRREAVHHVPLRLDELAHEAALEFSPLIAQKRLAFELDAVPQSVPADPWMAGELVRNLLANAIGHTPPHHPLGIVVREALGAPELVVWDSGPGIVDAQRERLFEPFAAATRGTGVGLGLSICRQIAQAMGAEVTLFNRSDGERVVGVDAVVRWAARPVASTSTGDPSSPDAPVAWPVRSVARGEAPFPVPPHGVAVPIAAGDPA
jgi:two-component system sensor histidine kinase TctE